MSAVRAAGRLSSAVVRVLANPHVTTGLLLASFGCTVAGVLVLFPDLTPHVLTAGAALAVFVGGWSAGRRNQSEELAELRTYADSARSSAFALDRDEVGSTTGQVNAQSALTAALLDVWHPGIDRDEVHDREVSMALDLAGQLLDRLYAQRCQIVTPDTRSPLIERADDDLEEMVRNLWPPAGGGS